MKSKITLPTRLMLSFWNKKLKLFLALAAFLTGSLQAQPTIVVPTITTPGASTWT